MPPARYELFLVSYPLPPFHVQQGSVECGVLDLMSLDAVDAFATEFLVTGSPLDVIVANAGFDPGAVAPRTPLTVDVRLLVCACVCWYVRVFEVRSVYTFLFSPTHFPAGIRVRGAVHPFLFSSCCCVNAAMTPIAVFPHSNLSNRLRSYSVWRDASGSRSADRTSHAATPQVERSPYALVRLGLRMLRRCLSAVSLLFVCVFLAVCVGGV